jgi:transcriptional regulator GlxA family with amidase domain
MNTRDSRINWAIGRMNESLDRPLRVADVARAVNLSPSQFTRLFRGATGTSPARYLQLRRLERARLLLETTFLSVKEVMQMVGVRDPSHFSRDFTRHHGMAPSRLRTAWTEAHTADVKHDR